MAGVVGSWVAEVARRRVARTLAAYSMAAFGLLQGLDVVVSRLALPAFWMKLAVVVALAGFPVVAALAWVFDITPDGVVRTAPAQASRPATPVQIVALGASLAIAGGLGWVVWRQAARSEQAADPVDDGLRALLHQFRADSQEIPPWFRQRVRTRIDQMVADPATKAVVYPRLKKLWPMLSRTLAAHGLPEELAFVAVVESGLNPSARSSVGSVGLWQFQPGTARQFGLHVGPEADDRLDPALSTEAAAKYFANLMAEFGHESFMLAIASYNVGESKMRKVLFDLAQQPGGLRAEDRTFWHLYRLQAFRDETLEFVPSILAAAVLFHDPGRYGLE